MAEFVEGIGCPGVFIAHLPDIFTCPDAPGDVSCREGAQDIADADN